MPGTSDLYAASRLNFERQRKRAKDLLRAVRAGNAAAGRRLADAVARPVPDAVTLKLADAQFAIARELRFMTWRDLRTAKVVAEATIAYLLLSVILLATTLAATGAQRSADASTSTLIAESLRAGRYAEAVRLIDGVLLKDPDSGLGNIGDLVRGRPDMEVKKGTATFTCDVSKSGVRLPGSVNGQPVSWLLDTGANFSLISDGEAARLGMTINGAAGRAGDLAGGTVGARTATAERLTIGATALRNVTFLVRPASKVPWTAWPAGKQGILGLPIALALERVRWSSQSSCTVGTPADAERASTSAGAALSFDRLFVTTSVTVNGKDLPFTLDTGNQGDTQLWPRFGREFPEFVAKRGRAGTARLTQVGGAADHPTIVISDLILTIGGTDVTLPTVHLFAPPVGHDSSYGLLGVDVFANARDVTIDFQAMRLTVR